MRLGNTSQLSKDRKLVHLKKAINAGRRKLQVIVCLVAVKT